MIGEFYTVDQAVLSNKLVKRYHVKQRENQPSVFYVPGKRISKTAGWGDWTKIEEERRNVLFG